MPPSEAVVDLRPIGDDDRASWRICLGTAFGQLSPEGYEDRILDEMGQDRTLAAFDAGEVVGTAAWFPLELTLPGGDTIEAASVVAVTVLPSHRRRGILSQMMRRQLHELHAAGFSVALLTASEGGIYRRFGYGPATRLCPYEIDKRVARLAAAVTAPGTVRVISAEQAEEALPPLWEVARRQRPGELSIPPSYWREHFHELTYRGIDERRRFFAAYEHAGSIDGIVDYRRVDEKGPPRERAVEVDLLVTASSDAYQAIMAYLLGLDLAATMRMRHRPVDEPLRELLADRRDLRTLRSDDDLWIRALDVRAALAARRYAPGCAGELRLAVSDELCPWNEGTYLLRVDADGRASVEGPESAGAGAGADLELDVAGVGSVLLGGERFASLVLGGSAVEKTAGAAWHADALFRAEREPFATISF